MKQTMTEAMIETIVRNALKDIKKSPERSTRNLVDMAAMFATSDSQREFFSTIQEMLTDQNSAYYRMMEDIVFHVDTEHLISFGMNLGYRSCVSGARTIQENEKRLGCNIPWSIILQLPHHAAENIGAYKKIVREGLSLGIHSWMLFAQEDTETAFSLAQSFPECAFCLFCEPANVTPMFLDEAKLTSNLMVVLRFDENAPQTCQRLRESQLLYSVYYPYCTDDMELIENEDMVCEMEQMHPLFCVVYPLPDSPATVREQVYENIMKIRSQQKYQTILWDLEWDNRMLDRLISQDDCAICFDEDGNPNRSDCGCNLFTHSLETIFSQALLKEAK